jgi:hypothetical protein
VGGAKFGRHSGGGGWLGLPSRRLSPKHKEYSFLPRSSYLHDISLMFLMLYSPLDTALLLVLFCTASCGIFSSESGKKDKEKEE